MEKKRKIRFIVVWLLITAAFLAGVGAGGYA